MRKQQNAYNILFFSILCAFSLSGCAQTGAAQKKTLWVLTEQSNTDGYNLQAQLISEWMESAHTDVTVELEILPVDADLREIRLKQLRAQIMAGNGPDVYLLPTNDMVSIDYAVGRIRDETSVRIEPLFRDAALAMYNGVFADISAYYDADDALEKVALQTAVMDAGVIGGARYILPLHYDLPVLLTERKPDGDVSVTALTEAALTQGDTAALIGLQLPDDLSVFSQIFDYENGTMPLTADKIAAYMRLYQRWTASEAQAEQEWITAQLDAIDSRRIPSKTFYLEDYSDLATPSGFNEITSYVICRIYWDTAGLPCFRSTLSGTLQSAAIAKAHNFPLVMSPMRSADGRVTAEVTYYGAVGSSSQNPALAYEFLRQFLLEEYQWELYRPQVEGKDLILNAASKKYTELQCDGMVEKSWPVRTVGSTPHLWENIRYQNRGRYSSFILGSANESALYQDEAFILTDEDIPALDFEIDAVRFPIVQQGENTLQSALAQLNNDDGTPTDVDTDKLAQQVWTDLWWHLAEG